MNASELKKLNSRSLSHIARSLYILLLRKKAEQNQNIIDLVEIADYLYSDSKYFKTSSSLELAILVLNELESQGLVARASDCSDASWQGCTFTLPLFIEDSRDLPSMPFSMKTSWRPSSSFAQCCVLCGLSDPSFTQSELTAFTSYWAGRHEMRNQIAWERAFALRLLKSRSAQIKKAAGKSNLEIADVKTNDPNTTCEYGSKDAALSSDISQAETDKDNNKDNLRREQELFEEQLRSLFTQKS
ncbi:MAG: DnaT-like ssDNA-binding domain-containing protein [Succinivibrio sp.]